MQHISEFGKWCKNCKYESQDEEKEPCDDCLAESGKDDGRQPVHYVPKDKNAWCQTCKFGDQTEDNEPCLSECVEDPKTKQPSCWKKRTKQGKEPEKNAGKRRKLL